MTGTIGLHELVLGYRRGTVRKETILERVTEMVYREPSRFGFDDEDAAADAMLKYGRRISTIIDRYEDRGSAFEAYLGSSLRFLAKTVRRDRRRCSEQESVCERAEQMAQVASDALTGTGSSSELTAPEQTIATQGLTEQPATGNRLVFLLLKCVWDADDEDLRRVAEIARVDLAWLASAVAQARRSLDGERARFETMQERRNASWCRITLLESRIAEEAERGRRDKLAHRLACERRRFDRIRADIGAFKPVVPNSIVARILGVPKGTVDSGIYYLRKRVESCRDCGPDALPRTGGRG
ncbi:MAG TPA: hypothetical protein VMC79_05725 [Rectinemataceae bacterium]|nr:hypothetical protein [Rectinemataceae bacterium]